VLLRAALAPEQPPRYPYDEQIRERAHRIPWDEFVSWYVPSDPSELPDFAPADIEVLSDPAYADGARSMLAEGTRQGHLGTVGDHWAFAGPWGFDVTTVEQPVDIWHGDADRNVPVAHAHVLANLLPNARVRILADDGHFSIGVRVPEQTSLLADDAERGLG
jgi:pimeloyl-ACP methyl ester carboxylesterase